MFKPGNLVRIRSGGISRTKFVMGAWEDGIGLYIVFTDGSNYKSWVDNAIVELVQ